MKHTTKGLHACVRERKERVNKREIEIERERDRQTDRQTDGQTDREKETASEIETLVV